MIKLKKLLEETDPQKWAKDSAEKLLYALKYDCIDIGLKGRNLLRAYKYNPVDTYARKHIRTDRRPKDTGDLPNIIAEVIRNMHYPNKPSRYSTLFCSYRYATARGYASSGSDIYYVFPEKRCKLYMYSHDDSVDVFGSSSLNMNEIPDDVTGESMSRELGFTEGGPSEHALQFALPYIKRLAELQKSRYSKLTSSSEADLYDYFFTNFDNIFKASEIFHNLVGTTSRPNGFTIDTLYSISNLRYFPKKIKEYFEEIVEIKNGDEAIESGHEIYVEGDAYYLVNRDYYNEWIIYDDRTGEYSIKEHPELDAVKDTDEPYKDMPAWSHGDMS